MLKATAMKFASRVTESLRPQNKTLPESVEIVKTRKPRKPLYAR